MQSLTNIKSISCLKSHAAQISEYLELNKNPFIITRNGEAGMVIESIKQFQEKEELPFYITSQAGLPTHRR